MTDDEFSADAWIDAMLPVLRMRLSPESRAVVKLHLETAETFARLLGDFDFDDEAEPAPIYTP